MRLLVVALFVCVWIQPVARALDVGAAWQDAHHDVEFAPPIAQALSSAVTKSRSSDPQDPGCSHVGVVAYAPTTASSSARIDRSAPLAGSPVTRWILRHATTSAIP